MCASSCKMSVSLTFSVAMLPVCSGTLKSIILDLLSSSTQFLSSTIATMSSLISPTNSCLLLLISSLTITISLGAILYPQWYSLFDHSADTHDVELS